MADNDEDDDTTTDAPRGTDTGAQTAPDSAIVKSGEEPQDALARDVAPRQLGAGRYVLAGFFAGGMAVAYVASRALGAGWNRLADNVWLSQHAPFLTRIAEDERPTYTMLLGAALGLWVTIWAYRRDDIRTWTNEAAAELAKVTWPSKKEVTNSTVVVLVTSAFATIFLALLDRFWSFITNLVYGS
jgi:preprotein translocase subunit SecE